MIKSILKGENLKRVFFAFLKKNNAFYNYMNAFSKFHNSRSKGYMRNPSFDYFLNRCSLRDEPTDLIFDAFDWSGTEEGCSYWTSLERKFSELCSQIKEIYERNEDKKTIEDLKKEGWLFVYTDPYTSTDLWL